MDEAQELGRRAIKEAEAAGRRAAAQAQSIGQLSAKAGECLGACRKQHPDIRSKAYKVCVGGCESARGQRIARVFSSDADTSSDE